MSYSDVVPGPDDARTPEEFVRLLRRLRARSELTYRELEVRAQRHGLHLARSTTAAVLGRGALPRAGFVHAYVAACGLTPEPWLGARRRIAAACAAPAEQDPAVPESGTAGPEHGARTPAVPVVPAQLPSDISDFTGRTTHLRAIEEVLTGADGTPHGVVPTVAVSGMAGVGKTSLAVHAAHALTERFTGGRLFVDLRGASAAPAEPGDVLVRFLRALGMRGPAAVPDSTEELSSLYRTLSADRDILVVLDNAASERQIRPLLPGVGGPAVLITSRRRLTSMGPSRSVELGPLPAAHGVEMLARIVGADRVAAEPGAAADIVRSCGRCPLAVRIAGARLACRRQWPLARLADLLRDERRRLDELAIGDLSVRESLERGYATLPDATRPAFRLLGLLEVPDFSAGAAAALLDCPADRAETHLEALVDASLLVAVPAGGADGTRYRMHDLVRIHARERAVAEGRAG
ncbi:NB-ARC domain-containing protein [Streptomyces beigongshangae]|uniref:NB-ARC domain-containing protein n=1 Tax=Streptomyces beigongshangae TaxID=2841597 RepID=UPI001C862107|nr:NB-ARC domain-containing protein [Streptomyces sp. REN17]